METETTIWGKIASGDQQAYAELFRDLYKKLYNYGKKFTDDESIIEDTAQETFMIIWQKRESLSSIQFPTTYSFVVFRNTLFNRLKTQQRYTSDTANTEEPEFSIEHIIIRNETNSLTTQKIQKALAALTSRQREAIYLRFYEGLPYDEVAGMLGITTKATYKIIARALEELRQQLQISTSLLIWVLSRIFG